MYLANYGYLDPALKNNSSNALLFLVSKEAYRHAIAEFQSLAGLEPTGKIIPYHFNDSSINQSELEILAKPHFLICLIL
jgi:hypothetical protein